MAEQRRADDCEEEGRAVGPLLLLGVPGAGKGTQAKRLCARYGIPHISTGEMFRELAARNTATGRRMAELLQGGHLVPDELVCDAVAERLQAPDCRRGYVLDGFPRTVAQAEWLTGFLDRQRENATKDGGADPVSWDAVVIYLTVSYNDLYPRLLGRRVCPTCGRIYNDFSQPPRQPGVCDVDRTALIQRKDDDPDVVRERLVEYEERTLPLVEYYRRRGRLLEVRGTDPVERVSERIFKALESEGVKG